MKERFVGGLLAASLMAGPLVACENSEPKVVATIPTSTEGVQDFAYLGDEFTGAAELAKQITFGESYSIGDHKLTLGEIGNVREILPGTELARLARYFQSLGSMAVRFNIPLRLAAKPEEAPFYTLKFRLRQPSVKKHYMITANHSDDFGSIGRSFKNLKNAFTVMPAAEPGIIEDLSAFSFVADRGENPYPGSNVSITKGSLVTELCQSFVQADLNDRELKRRGLDSESIEKLRIVSGQETICNSLSRAVIFAISGATYEDYLQDLKRSPLEIGLQNDLFIPYLRFSKHFYEGLRPGALPIRPEGEYETTY